jgi:hypothetical protein
VEISVELGKFFERLGLHRLGGRRVLSSAMGVMYFALPGRRVRGPAVYEFSDRNVLLDDLN